MSNKFVCFSLMDSIDDIKFPCNYFEKLPKRFINYYILKKAEGIFEKINILNTEGYSIKLPITRDILEKFNQKKINTILERIVENIKDEQVSIITKPEILTLPEWFEVKLARQRELLPLFVFLLVKEIINLRNLNLKTTEIMIIDGNNKIIDFIIEFLYPELNYLTILTDYPNKYCDKVNYIYEDTGLNVIILDKKNKIEYSSDIVINLSEEENKNFYYLKKNVIYIDLSEKRYNARTIMVKRKDIVTIDDFTIKVGEKRIRKDMFEMILYINHYQHMRKFINQNFRKINTMYFKKMIKHYRVNIDKMYQCGYLLKRNKIILTSFRQ